MQECYNLEHRIIIHTKRMVYWPTARGTTVTGTVISGTEFSDFLCDRYNPPPQPLEKCNGCSQPFYVHHKLNYKNGVLVISRQN